jgi:hypothetical protein
MMKMMKKEKPILRADAMPEAFALRRIAWQLFATLTFRLLPAGVAKVRSWSLVGCAV